MSDAIQKFNAPLPVLRKGEQRPIVRTTLRAIWILAPEPFFEPIVTEGNALMPYDRLLIP
jgi:hypothetical protein